MLQKKCSRDLKRTDNSINRRRVQPYIGQNQGLIEFRTTIIVDLGRSDRVTEIN